MLRPLAPLLSAWRRPLTMIPPPPTRPLHATPLRPPLPAPPLPQARILARRPLASPLPPTAPVPPPQAVPEPPAGVQLRLQLPLVAGALVAWRYLWRPRRP